MQTELHSATKYLGGHHDVMAGVNDSLVRISFGLEDEEDLLADFAQALESIT